MGLTVKYAADCRPCPDCGETSAASTTPTAATQGPHSEPDDQRKQANTGIVDTNTGIVYDGRQVEGLPMPTKLIVKTELGTFTRTTARTYSHIVVVAGYRAELREAERLGGIARAREEAARYRRAVETNTPDDLRRDPIARAFDLKCHAKWMADGSYQKWAESCDREAAILEAKGPITTDDDKNPGVLGWCGRLDLARKLAAGREAVRYRTVRIFDVATGQAVL